MNSSGAPADFALITNNLLVTFSIDQFDSEMCQVKFSNGLFYWANILNPVQFIYQQENFSLENDFIDHLVIRLILSSCPESNDIQFPLLHKMGKSFRIPTLKKCRA